MAKFFFLLSGEHQTLPFCEAKAILEAEGHAYQILEKLDQAARLELGSDGVKAIENRAALTKLCGLELYTCQSQIDEIVDSANSVNLEGVLEAGDSFAVRIKHVKNYASEINGMDLERRLGEIILNKAGKVEVNLENPDKTFTGILTNGRFVFGSKIAEVPPTPFVERRPMKKPFFHPSAMPAKLARCMVNLAQPKAGDLVFDPFCGTGSMLIEAALIGCRVLGSDIKRKMAEGTFQNLGHFKIRPDGILVADAQSLPITKVDCVVTDPPYGRSATTLKRPTKQIFEEALTSVEDLLDGGSLICMAAPESVNIGGIGTALGYKHVQSHSVYVHRSLTREIAVFEKV